MDLLGMPGEAEGWTPDEVDLTQTPASIEDVAEEDVESMRERAKKVDPNAVEHIDEVVAEALRLQKTADVELEEGQKTPGQMFRELSPAQKAALLATYHVTTLGTSTANHPMWINLDAVPDTIRLAWLSPNIVERLGMRGFRRVLANPRTQKWAPNARQLGSAKFITHANYTLCAIDSDVSLERQVAAYRQTNAILDENDERFRSAIRSGAGQIGLAKDKAAQLDTSGRGVVATRGDDPEFARRVREKGPEHASRDFVQGEGD